MDKLDKGNLLNERLGPEKFREVADVRRTMWTGGLGGLLVGASLSTLALEVLPPAAAPAGKGEGAAAQPALSARARAGLLRSRQVAFILMGGAAGSYLGCLFLGTPALQRFSAVWR